MTQLVWRKSSFTGSENCVEVAWRKSSFTANENCVELAHLPTGIAVRDSKDPSGPMLTFDQPFFEAVKRMPPR